MWTQAKICNIALSALLLQRQITNLDTDTSNEGKVLKTHFNAALYSSLEDMDLDSTSTVVTLELLEEDPDDIWDYAYKYPKNCALFRRIVSPVETDNRKTHIPKRVRMHRNKKSIFTNQDEAQAEIITTDFPLDMLSTNAGLAVAYKLAMLSSPLIVGKGSDKLREEIERKYAFYKAEAQEQDRIENFTFQDDETISEFVEARME